MEFSKTRDSIVEGIFYPARRNQLKATLKQLMEESPTEQGRAPFIISPHAAYHYAGNIMASAFKSASLRAVRTVVLLGPVHGDSDEAIYLPESTIFRTPLGNVSVNRNLVAMIERQNARIIYCDRPHTEEHCIEVQLPFVQFLFPRVDIVPVLLGVPTRRNIELLAHVLRLTFKEMYDYILLVVSSNNASSEYGRKSRDESHLFTELVRNKDWHGLCDALDSKNTSACGAGCVAAVLASRDYHIDADVLETKESAFVDGNEKDNVFYVAYGAEQKED